jgi:hypothetical protein
MELSLKIVRSQATKWVDMHFLYNHHLLRSEPPPTLSLHIILLKTALYFHICTLKRHNPIMNRLQQLTYTLCFSLILCLASTIPVQGQEMVPKYPTLELFTNTPCPICGSQNPGLFSRLANYEGQYHLISFYPGQPYSSCIFYQANISENAARLNFYQGQVFGTPTVAINGTEFKSSNGVTNTVLNNITGNESWLSVKVDETFGGTRTASITLTDHVGGSLTTGKLYAVVVEREIMYNAPNGETVHYNVFRKFLSSVSGDDVDLGSGMAARSYQYTVEGTWQADEIHVVAWLKDPNTKEIYNSGTRFDPTLSGTNDIGDKLVLNIYPNPVSDVVNINVPEDALDAPLRIFNTNGQLIYKQATSGDTHVSIQIDNWPAGRYVVEIGDGEKRLRGVVEVVK